MRKMAPRLAVPSSFMWARQPEIGRSGLENKGILVVEPLATRAGFLSRCAIASVALGANGDRTKGS
jgi:hypothetical protein